MKQKHWEGKPCEEYKRENRKLDGSTQLRELFNVMEDALAGTPCFQSTIRPSSSPSSSSLIANGQAGCEPMPHSFPLQTPPNPPLHPSHPHTHTHRHTQKGRGRSLFLGLTCRHSNKERQLQTGPQSHGNGAGQTAISRVRTKVNKLPVSPSL